MIKYQVRSRELLDVVNDIRSKRLIMSPYFQRNLVWRQLHKVDFIKTILLGYPFPQIFIAKGAIDLERMSNTSCVVDGQQRMNTILEFIKDKIVVDKRKFSDLSAPEKEDFLKYQVPIIDLDIDNDNPEIIEIFKRLNRTFYSLSTIERLATEYAPSEFMLTAKLLSGELRIDSNTDEDSEDYLPLQIDPNIPQTFIEWATTQDVSYYKNLMIESEVFSTYELTRQVHLLFTLNCMSTYVEDYYARNELAFKHLEDYSEEFPQKNEILTNFEWSANFISEMELPSGSYWLNKANMFSIITLLAKNKTVLEEKTPAEIKNKLDELEGGLTEEYRLAAREAVNNKKERLVRNKILSEAILEN